MTLQKALKIFDIPSLDGLDHDSLKKAYRTLASQKHPDKEGGSSEEFVELREAYLFLLTKTPQSKTASGAKVEDTNLKELSKDEILAKYYQDTQTLQQKVESYELVTTNQIRTLEVTRKDANSLLEKFEERKNTLRKELDQNLLSLERKINPGFFQRLMFFFRPRLTEDEFWRMYNLEVQRFTRKDADIDIEFFKELLSLYGGALNTVADTITEL